MRRGASRLAIRIGQPGRSIDFREFYTDLIETQLGASAAPIFPESHLTTGDISVTG